jgi:hypothetical protein
MTDAVLYVWKEPRPADAAEAAALVDLWLDGDATDRRRGPFESSTDVTWFHREITGDAPPIWNPDKPARNPDLADRVAVVPLDLEALRDQLDDVYGLAAKYDLVVYDPQRESVHAPLAELIAHQSATFWPSGAIRAGRAGLIGLAVALGAYIVGIPIVSGIVIAVGAFLVVLSVWTFIHEGQVLLRQRSGAGASGGPGAGPGPHAPG